MTGVALIVATVLLLTAAVLLPGGRRSPGYRLTHLQVVQAGQQRPATRPPVRGGGSSRQRWPGSGPRSPDRDRAEQRSGRGQPPRPWLLRGTPVLVAAASWVLVGGWGGVVAAAATGAAAWWVIHRLPAPAPTRDRRAAAAALPYGVDLLAAALRSGAPVDRALAMVGRALGGPLGRRFDEVGRALRLGVHGVDGWHALADVPGAAGVIAAAVRTAESGATLAAACARAAAELREQRDAEADAAAQRAGVLIVLPLGACFLPAFVLVGVVPILLGVLHDVLA